MVLDDHAGRTDGYGNELAVTAPALADELAGAAELAQGKLAGRPFALVRGRPDLVLPAGEDGPGAAPWSGSRARTCSGTAPARPWSAPWPADPADRLPFGAPATADEMAAAVARVARRARPSRSSDGLAVPADPRLAPLAFAHGWRVETAPKKVLRKQ